MSMNETMIYNDKWNKNCLLTNGNGLKDIL